MSDLEKFMANCHRIEGRMNAFRQSIESAGTTDDLWNLMGEAARIWIEIGDLNASTLNVDHTLEIRRLRYRLWRIENLCGALILALEGDPEDTTVVR
jgi:hypothetical protein